MLASKYTAMLFGLLNGSRYSGKDSLIEACLDEANTVCRPSAQLARVQIYVGSKYIIRIKNLSN